MAYEFPVANCENCGEPLVVDENTEIIEEEGFPTKGCCSKCLVFYEMNKV